jgi:putative ABC transport system permease protein
MGALSDDDLVSNILFSDGTSSELNQQELNKYFPDLKDNFTIKPLELSDGSKARQKLADNLKYSTRYTAFIALLLSGFCVFITIMLSTNQKIKEIGIRKTIGATNKQISMHFIYESLILGFLGGILGCIVAQIIISIKLNSQASGNYSVSLQSGLISLGACAAISLIFGLIPALKAGRKNPIECLKYSL